MTLKFLSRILILNLAMFAACGGSDAVDKDGDGFTSDVDCNDANAQVYPGANDPCDGVDQNCDGKADEQFDFDNDGVSTCAGDCRDQDDTTFPGAPEIQDGLDNDCDGIVDNNTNQSDDDGDGFSEDQGDCNDTPGEVGLSISPSALEIAVANDGSPEGVDNDCDGMVDEALPPCPNDAAEGSALALAHAAEACHGLQTAFWDTGLGIDDRSRLVAANFGTTYVPMAGETMSVLSTGIAGDETQPGFISPGSGTTFGNSTNHPDPVAATMGATCEFDDPVNVNDYTEMVWSMNVPSNAKAFSFDFNFMSAEFPTFVCTSFDDTFLAILDSGAFQGNVSFDSAGSRVSINVGFFDVCAVGAGGTSNCTGNDALAGTGYDGLDGGGTGWLTTTAPVVPGEKITLRFVIFDEGDFVLDSTVLIDNFRWELEAVDSPITVE